MQALLQRYPNEEWVCFGDRRAFEAMRPSPPVECVVVDTRESPTVAAAADGNRSPADMLRLTRAVWRAKPDVFFSPAVYTYFPLPPGQRAAVTILDAIAERFPHLTLPSWRARLFWKAKVQLALAQADAVLTISDYAARDLVRVLHVDPARLRVAVLAPSAAFSPSTADDIAHEARACGIPLGARWFTYCGGFNPHKRVDLIVDAHARLVADTPNPPHLLLVGTTTSDVFHGNLGALREAIDRAGTSHLVHWLGFLEDERLRHLHSGAIAALLPSECEGFGLPAVEAAACGTSVIATTESPLPELLQGGGIFIRPGSIEPLLHAMRRLTDDPPYRDALAAKARTAASALTWDSAAASAFAAIQLAAQ